MAYRIAKYLRISTEDIDLDGIEKYESDSISNQRLYLDGFISNTPEFQGCEVIEELDDGRTGTNFSRPGVRRLLKMAESGEINCIVCKDLSRFGRSYIEVGDFLEQKFPLWGVRFISLNDGYDSSKLNSGVVGIDVAFRNLVYELYSRDISQKTRQGKITATKNGKCTNSAPVYGYLKSRADKRKLVVDEAAASVVIRIFDLAEQGLQPIQIAKLFNDEGIPSPKEHKKLLGVLKRLNGERVTFWNGTTVSNIIHDEQYTGKLIFGRTRVTEVGKNKCVDSPKNEWIVMDNAIPVIITEERFNEINAIIPKKSVPKKKPVGKALLFKGKLKCGQCGMSLGAYETKHGLKYYCRTPKLTTKYGCCGGDRLYEKDISKVVLVALQHRISVACEMVNKLGDKSKSQDLIISGYRKELDAIQKAIEKCKTAKMSLWEKHHSKQITTENLRAEKDKFDAQIQQYNDEADRIRLEIAYLEAAKTKSSDFVRQFNSYNGLQELTREAVVNLIEEIRVFSAEKIQITFCFADEYDLM